QIKGYGIPWCPVVISEVCYRPGRINECDITHVESDGFIVMGHRRLATNLKDREVVVHDVEASVPVGPFNPVSIATNIQGREPADTHRVHPTCKGVRFNTFRIVPPTHRAE